MSDLDVLLLTPRWARDGGVAAHVQVSVAALAEAGVHVRVLAAQIEGESVNPDVTLTAAPELFNARLPIASRLGGALADAPEVIHLHQIDDPELVRGLRASAPVLSTIHAYSACPSGVYYFKPGEECWRGHGVGCIPNLLLRGCSHTRHPKTLPLKYRNSARAGAALRAADLVICGSSAMDRHLAANGVSRRAIVPFFPTTAPLQGSGHEGRRRVVFGGRMVRPKGVEVLIEAAAEIDGEIVLCGEGRELDALQALAAARGVAERVHFRGWLDADELARELAEASVVTMPSLWPEPFGLLGIEAMASGRPVVASATGGILDWLADGVNGLAVPPGDVGALARALNELLADPTRQHEMGAAGREMVAARFTREAHVEGLRGAYADARAGWGAAK